MTASWPGSGTAPRAGDALEPVSKVITQDLIDAYADLSGDQNPLHVDPAFASTTRYGGTIAHGLLSAGVVSTMLERAFPGAWAQGGRLELRFLGAVRPGDTITAHGTIDGLQQHGDGTHVEGSLGCRVGDGPDALTGRFSLEIRANPRSPRQPEMEDG